MNKLTYRLPKLVTSLFVALTLFIAGSCDLYDDDVVPDETQVTVEKADFYTLPNSSTIIDLKTLVKSFSQVDLTVTSQPLHGNLKKISEAVFSYKPNESFKSGKDYFKINIKSEGRTLREDTVVIHVGQDTTEFPCSLFAIEDSVVIPFSFPNPPRTVSVPVLKNDRICGINNDDLVLFIFSAPQHGQANVMAGFNFIVYRAAAGYAGEDQFVYKISSISDSTIFSLGLVRISNISCTTTLYDDYAPNMISDSTTTREFYFNVLFNDNICARDSANDVISISEAPHNGTASVFQDGKVKYIVPNTVSQDFTDSLTYTYCQGSACQSAKVVFNFMFDAPCEIQAQDDSVDLPFTVPMLRAHLQVLQNDVLCAGLKELTIIAGPDNGEAVVSDQFILYDSDSPTPAPDSIRYKVCDWSGGCSEATLYIFKH